MNTVAAVLRELEIDYIDETNLSILKQRAIKPIMALLNWFYNLDFYNLITFLRSDAVLLNSQSLKDILEFWQTCQKLELPFCPDLYDKFARIPQIAILGALHKHLSDPLILAKAIITDFNLIKIFDQEIDFANITKFLNLIAEFLAVNLDYSHDLGGLLRYFADNENAEYFNQTGIQHQNVLKILTIHKSKGLEFDTVIMMQKNSSSTGRLPELSIYPEYTSDFSGLSSCLFTYNFTSLIKDSPADPLSELQRKREDVEAINVWYVALTRAKRNLFALIAYSMKDGLEKYYSSFDDAKPDINKLICGSLAAEFVTESLQVDNSLIIKMGELSKYNTRHDDDALILSGLSDISAWFSATPSELFTARDDWQIQIPPADYHLLARAKVLGNIAHYYLEQIRFDSQAARKQAADRTLAFYGSLIPASDILTIITKVDAIITENFPLFDPANWDQCYCEWSVFDNNKNEYRIDRLLISHSRKQVQVIDYKTGEITAEDQIRKYNELLKKIPFFAKNHYDILEGVFLKIKL